MRFVMLFLFVPFIVNASTCFVAETQVPRGIPQFFCVESVEEVGGEINLTSLSEVSLPTSLRITSVQENSSLNDFTFSARALLLDHYNGTCDYQITAYLMMKGESHLSVIDTENLEFSAQVREAYDICHSPVKEYNIQYNKI